jgi:hypothetical protein
MTALDLPVSYPPLYHSDLISNESTVQRGAWPVQGKLEEPGPRVALVGSTAVFEPATRREGASNLKPRRLSGCVMRKARQLDEADRQRARSRAVPRDIGLAFCPRWRASGPASPILLHHRLGLRRIPFQWRSNPHSGRLPINRADGSPRFDIRCLQSIDALQ